MQLIPATLFQDATPVATPVATAQLTFGEKVAGAVDVIKRQLLRGKRIIAAWSAGKDSSVMLSLTLTAMEQLQAEGFALPELYVLHSDTLIVIEM